MASSTSGLQPTARGWRRTLRRRWAARGISMRQVRGDPVPLPRIRCCFPHRSDGNSGGGVQPATGRYTTARWPVFDHGWYGTGTPAAPRLCMSLHKNGVNVQPASDSKDRLRSARRPSINEIVDANGSDYFEGWTLVAVRWRAVSAGSMVRCLPAHRHARPDRRRTGAGGGRFQCAVRGAYGYSIDGYTHHWHPGHRWQRRRILHASQRSIVDRPLGDILFTPNSMVARPARLPTYSYSF